MPQKSFLWTLILASFTSSVVGMPGPALTDVTNGIRPLTYTLLLIVGVIAMPVLVPAMLRAFGVRSEDRRIVVRVLRLSPAIIAVVAMFAWVLGYYGHRSCEMLPPGLRCDCFYVGATKPATTPLQLELRDWYRAAYTTICKLPIPGG